MSDGDRRIVNPQGIVVGLAIVVVGVVLLLNQSKIIDVGSPLRFWPVQLIVFGLAQLSRPRREGPREGGLLLFIGVWLLLNELRLLRYGESWLLLLLGIGVAMVWKTIASAADSRAHKAAR